jgi:benzoyl-CoA reductase/2-hydroxyglutaryl-CoA dehydratase subunit BcrC/BadD/HgdB
LTLRMIPRPDMTVTTGFTCETSPKTNELIEELYGIPAYYIDTCQDRELREYPDASRTIGLAAKSMRKLSRRIEKQMGFEIKDDMLWEVIRARKPFEKAMGRLLDLIRNSDPMPIGSSHLNILGVLGSIPFKPPDLTAAVSALDLLYKELQARVMKGIGITAKGAPRVLAVLPNHQSDPRLEYLANQMGMAIVASDFEFSTRRKPADSSETIRDPYEVIMSHLHGSLAQSLGGRIPIILDACRRLHIDGVLDHYHVGCRDVAGDAMAIREALVRELGMPVLMFEWENFDPRVYNHEEYKSKLEIFKSMMETNERVL